MNIGKAELELLANTILEKLREEFANKHLSRNLINTIKIESVGDEINIQIPAQTYDTLLFQSVGVVVHTGNTSYASALDKEGSEFYAYPSGKKITPRNHKGYIDKIINKALLEWSSLIGKDKIKKMEG